VVQHAYAAEHVRSKKTVSETAAALHWTPQNIEGSMLRGMKRVVGMRWEERKRLDGDNVIWDDRCTMHKANADISSSERRSMHRIGGADGAG